MNPVDYSARIMRLFDKIRVMTAELLNDFSVKKFQDIVRERSTIISAIKYEVSEQNIPGSLENSAHEISKEIELCLREVQEMDVRVMEIVQYKMDEIRHELKGLTKKTPAVLAYSYHKRR